MSNFIYDKIMVEKNLVSYILSLVVSKFKRIVKTFNLTSDKLTVGTGFVWGRVPCTAAWGGIPWKGGSATGITGYRSR